MEITESAYVAILLISRAKLSKKCVTRLTNEISACYNYNKAVFIVFLKHIGDLTALRHISKYIIEILFRVLLIFHFCFLYIYIYILSLYPYRWMART